MGAWTSCCGLALLDHNYSYLFPRCQVPWLHRIYVWTHAFIFPTLWKSLQWSWAISSPKNLSKNFTSLPRIDFCVVCKARRSGSMEAWVAPLFPPFGPMPIFVATAVSFVGWLLLVAYLIFADTESGRAQEQGSQRWYIPLLQRSSADFDKLNLPRIQPFHIFDVNHHNNSLSHYILQKPRLKVRISRPLHIFNFLHSSDQLVRDSSYQNCSIFQTLYRLPYGRLGSLLPHAIHHHGRGWEVEGDFSLRPKQVRQSHVRATWFLTQYLEKVTSLRRS